MAQQPKMMLIYHADDVELLTKHAKGVVTQVPFGQVLANHHSPQHQALVNHALHQPRVHQSGHQSGHQQEEKTVKFDTQKPIYRDPCRHFNRAYGCNMPTCTFAHVCKACRGNHAEVNCHVKIAIHQSPLLKQKPEKKCNKCGMTNHYTRFCKTKTLACNGYQNKTCQFSDEQCRFKHECSSCQGPHPNQDCQQGQDQGQDQYQGQDQEVVAQ